MGQKLTRNNHYISQFYIKEFYGDSSCLWIYDKEKDNYFKNVAQNIFYKKDMNITTINGVENDEIEKMQALLEGKIKVNFEEVKSFIDSWDEHTKISCKNMELLIWFAYFTFWRNPQTDKLYDSIKDGIDVDLVLRILDQYFMIQIQKDGRDDFGSLFKRMLLPYIMLEDKSVVQRIVKNSRIIGTKEPSLLNDFPIICYGKKNFSKYIGEVEFIFSDFVFPITKNLVFIYSENCAWNEIDVLLHSGSIGNITVELFTEFLSYFRDTALFINAERFVCCEDENRLKKIQKISGKEILIFVYLRYFKEIIRKKQCF